VLFRSGEVAVKTEGTGLGLAISQDIINRMGGEITVVSQLGVGSSFSFELDLSDPETSSLSIPEIAPTPQHLISAAIASSTLPQTANLLEPTKSLSILIAEDISYNQMLLQRFLQRLGYESDVASNGIEVLAKLQEKPYDVILMDIKMPQMDGMEVTERIIAEYAEGDRPYIIALSANMTEEDRTEYLAAGMNAAIGKPFVLAELEQALSQVKP